MDSYVKPARLLYGCFNSITVITYYRCRFHILTNYFHCRRCVIIYNNLSRCGSSKSMLSAPSMKYHVWWFVYYSAQNTISSYLINIFICYRRTKLCSGVKGILSYDLFHIYNIYLYNTLEKTG